MGTRALYSVIEGDACEQSVEISFSGPPQMNPMSDSTRPVKADIHVLHRYIDSDTARICAKRPPTSRRAPCGPCACASVLKCSHVTASPQWRGIAICLELALGSTESWAQMMDSNPQLQPSRVVLA